MRLVLSMINLALFDFFSSNKSYCYSHIQCPIFVHIHENWTQYMRNKMQNVTSFLFSPQNILRLLLNSVLSSIFSLFVPCYVFLFFFKFFFGLFLSIFSFSVVFGGVVPNLDMKDKQNLRQDPQSILGPGQQMSSVTWQIGNHCIDKQFSPGMTLTQLNPQSTWNKTRDRIQSQYCKQKMKFKPQTTTCLLDINCFGNRFLLSALYSNFSFL